MTILSFNSKLTYYICDFLNIFSDFREMKYKQYNINFHQIKDFNIIPDTLEFFNFFFTKFIKRAKIETDNNIFIFIVKKIKHYNDNVFENILSLYDSISIHFYIIQSKYNDTLLDKNKDDFLCQYVYHNYNKQYNCILISNDLYRDNSTYISYFLTFSYLKINHVYYTNNILNKKDIYFNLNQNTQLYQNVINRQSIPKIQLPELINR
jgi:hypothetical protein